MTAVKFDHVTKAYDLQAGSRTVFSALKLVTGSSGISSELFHALSDVSFEVKKGEAFGIIGRNGAGKSTILKIIAGVTKPTRGAVEVNGLVSSLIELGAGFHPDMTGRENVYMSGAIMGLSKKYIDKKFNEIVDFAELWDFIDVPVKKYSSGMYARLGFAVAVSIEPEILIIDEILSVGDVFFQQKCFTKMRQIIEKGTTFIFVTHDNAAMQNLCNRALVIDAGQVEYVGNTAEAVNRYYAKVGAHFGKEQKNIDTTNNINISQSNETISVEDVKERTIFNDRMNRHGSRGLEIMAARIVNETGIDTLHIPMQGKLLFYVVLRANQDIPVPCAGMHLYDRMGNLVFAAGTPQHHYQLPSLNKGEELIVKFDIRFNVGPGEYTFSLLSSEPSLDGGPNIGYFHDQYDRLGPIVVTADYSEVLPFYGIAELPMKISHSSPINSSQGDCDDNAKNLYDKI